MLGFLLWVVLELLFQLLPYELTLDGSWPWVAKHLFSVSLVGVFGLAITLRLIRAAGEDD
jgi:hypothetical protein